MSVSSLGYGQVGATNSILYQVPSNTQTTVSLMTFSNNTLNPTYLSVYKTVKGVNYLLSPLNMCFPAGYSATFDSPITLSSNDSIYAVSIINNAVDFTVNGDELPTEN